MAVRPDEAIYDLLEWCRENGVQMFKTADLEVHFAATPLAQVPASPPPVIEGAEKMSPVEYKAALEQAERERLLFRSA